MAEQKELGIKITGDITDITGSLSDLVGKLEEIVDKTVSILVAVNDSELEELDNELESLDNQTLNETVDVEDSELETLESDLEEIDGQVLQETLEVDSTGIEEAKTGLDEIGTAAETASGAVTESMDTAGKSVEELGDKAKDTSDKTSDIGNQAKETGKKAEAGFDQALLALAGLTAGLEIAAEKVQDMNISFDKMSNTVGSIPEQEMRDMIATMTNAKFPASEALTYITLLKQMGLTSKEELGQSASDMNKLRIATGSSEESMRKFANSMVVMGVDIANIPSIFNAVAYANANIIGGFDTYIQWMQKFDSAFAEMGLNIDQTAVIIAAATKKWGGGRAAYSGLNEAMKESNGNLEELEKRLGMQPGALSKASEETAKYSGKIDRNAKSVQDHTTATQKAGEVIDDVNVKYGDWVEIIGGAGAAVVAFGTTVGIVIPKVLKWFDSVWGTEWATSYVNKLKSVGETIKGWGTTITNTIKGWMGWGDDAGKAGYNMAQKLEGQVENPTFLSKLKDFGNKVSGTIKTWLGWGETTKSIDMVKGMDGTWTMKAPGFKEKVIGFFRNLPQTIITTITEKLPSLSKIGSLIPESLATSIKAGLPKIFSAVSVIGDLGMATLLEQVRSGLTDIAASFDTGNPKMNDFNRNLQYMNEGLFYSVPALGQVALGVDWLNGVITGLFEGKGFDAFGDSFKDVGDRVNRDAAAIGEQFKQIFGFDIPEQLNPLNWQKAFWNFDVNGLISGFMDGLKGLGDQIGGLFSGNLNIDIFGWIFGSLNAQWVSFSAWIGTIPAQITAFFSDLPANLGRLVGDAIIFLLQGVYNGLLFIKELPNMVMSGLQGLYAQVSTFVTNIPVMINTALQGLGGTIYASLTGVVEKVKLGVNGIIDQLKSFIKWVQDLPKTIGNALSNLGATISNELKAIPNKIKIEIDKIIQKFKDLESWLKGLPELIGKWIKKTFNDAVDFIHSIPDKIRAELDKIIKRFTDFVNWLGSLPQQLYQAIVNAFNGFIKGLQEKFPAISDILGKIAGLFPHSPPKFGPLKDIMEWGGNMSDAIKSGFDDKFPSLAGHFAIRAGELKDIWDGMVGSGMLSNFNIPDNQMNVINNAMENLNQPNNVNNKIDFSFKIDNVNAATTAEAREALQNVEQAVKDVLANQLAQKGINLF